MDLRPGGAAGPDVHPAPHPYPEQTVPVLAFDIGGTKLAVGVVHPDGSRRNLMVEPTLRAEGPQAVIRRLFDLGHASLAAGGTVEAVAAVGISCGGPLDAASGVLVKPPHLPGWVDVPIVAMAEAEFGVPAFLENDATAAAWGEYVYGAARGTRSAVYLTISTGVGGGSVIDGRLYRGAAGNGGELGHVTVRPGGRLCTCGRHGCLEAYCSGTQIALRAEEAVAAARAAGRETALRRGLTAADVSAAAADGDPVAGEVWAETVALVGQAITDLVNVLEPDVVVLGGGVTRAGAMLLDPVRAAVERGAMAPAAAAARVVLAGLGDMVGVVGAGAVAFERLALLGTLQAEVAP